MLSWGGVFSQLSFTHVLFSFKIFHITLFRVVLSFEPPHDHNNLLAKIFLMKLDNFYHLDYSDYWPHFFIVILITFRPICHSAFFTCFMSNSRVHTESWTELFIWTTGIDYSNFVNHDQAQVLSSSKYSLLVLSVAGIEPATFRWFHSEAFSNQTPYPLCHVFGKDTRCSGYKFNQNFPTFIFDKCFV